MALITIASSGLILAIFSILMGIIILIFPRALSTIVAIYLIVVGILQLITYF